MIMRSHKIHIDDYAWFSVALDDNGEPQLVTECRVVWSPGRQPNNAMMTERVRRAIEQAKRLDAAQ